MGQSRQTAKTLFEKKTGTTSKTVQINQFAESVNSEGLSELANNFIEFFASVATKLRSNFPTIDNVELIQSVTHSMFVRDTNEDEIK